MPEDPQPRIPRLPPHILAALQPRLSQQLIDLVNQFPGAEFAKVVIADPGMHKVDPNEATPEKDGSPPPDRPVARTAELRRQASSLPGTAPTGSRARRQLIEDVAARLRRIREGGTPPAMTVEDVLSLPFDELRQILATATATVATWTPSEVDGRPVDLPAAVSAITAVFDRLEQAARDGTLPEDGSQPVP